jgi:hypothetical protein
MRGTNDSPLGFLRSSNGWHCKLRETLKVYTTPWSVPDFEWSHLAFVIEPTGIRVYVNEREFVLTVVPQLNPSVKTTLGGVPTNPTSWFSGYVDEIRLYNTPLSEYAIRTKVC